jgi:ribosomal-protein-alanine N-acetyltransferase
VTTFHHDGYGLRKPERRDAERLFTLKNDAATARLLAGFNTGYTHEEIEAWIARHGTAEHDIVWVIVDRTDRCVGHMGLYGLDQRVRSAEFGILVGPDSRRRGLGEACLRYALDFAWESLNLQRVSLQVLATNHAAIRLYERVGFVLEGILRRAQYKDGQYLDVRLMAVLRD